MTQEDAFAADLLRGHTDTIVLGVLRHGDQYGFEIYKAIRDATGGDHEIKEATLYADLPPAREDGLVEAYWGDETQGGRRKYYRITDAGRAAVPRQRHGLGRHATHHRLPAWTSSARDTEGTAMNSDIHRLLDEAFAGIEMTPEVQDLKEEMRANLVARIDELEAAGLSQRMPRARRSPSSATCTSSLDGCHGSRAEGVARRRRSGATACARSRASWSAVVVASVVAVALAARGRTRRDGCSPSRSPARSRLALGARAPRAGIVGSSLAQETTIRPSDASRPRRRLRRRDRSRRGRASG